MVGRHDADAAASGYAQRGRVVGRNGGSISHGLDFLLVAGSLCAKKEATFLRVCHAAEFDHILSIEMRENLTKSVDFVDVPRAFR